MKVLVTGASGFLGSHVAEQLSREGHDVRALVRKSSNTKFLESLRHVELAYGAIEDARAVEEAVKGVDAIVRMGRVLTGLGALDEALRANPSHRLLGSGSLHASLIEGGQELSSYAERCLLQLERRTVPGETPALVEEQVRQVLDGDDGEVRTTFVREPFEVSEDEPVVEMVRRHAGEPEVVGAPFWADSAVFAAAGIPTVLFGPKGEGAHAEVEWVDLASLERCKDIYLTVARELCA